MNGKRVKASKRPRTPLHSGKVKIISFGFKYGQPQANYYFDVSFTTNPARQEQWGLFGTVDQKMIEFVLSQEKVKKFIDLVVPLIEHIAHLDSYQVVAIGCNSGRHRSPIITNEIASRLMDSFSIEVQHRDLTDYEAFVYTVHPGKTKK